MASSPIELVVVSVVVSTIDAIRPAIKCAGRDDTGTVREIDKSRRELAANTGVEFCGAQAGQGPSEQLEFS